MDDIELLRARVAELEATERATREALWLGHGHTTALYGDDGEMQCCACKPVTDYKRLPVSDCVIAAFRALQGASSWVPVSEGLPKTSGRYLIYGKGHDSDSRKPPMQVTEEQFANGHWCTGYIITHWREMPAPPLETKK